MKYSFRACTFILIVLVVIGTAYANTDRKGSHDYPLISRLPGFWIASYKDIANDSHTFRDSAKNKILIEGHTYFIEYRLKSRGQEPGQLMILNYHESTLKKIDAEIHNRTDKDLFCKVTKEGKEIWIHVHALDRLYRLTIVESEKMEQEMTADPEAPFEEKASAAADIHEAASKGSLEQIKAFLANGEKIDVKDNYGMTPLYHAAANGHKGVCEFCISQGADLDAGREIGFVPLSGALNNRTESGVEIFKLLVTEGADFNVIIGGYPLLHQTVVSCHDEKVRDIAEFLISKTVDVNRKGYQDRTPLHMVGCKEICELLISKGADIEARDSNGQTPLWKACSDAKLDISRLLISMGAEVNTKDNRGWTPLRQLHSQGLTARNTEISDLLVKHGAVK